MGFIKDESDFVFGHDCLDISDIYLMYYFCKSSKVESNDLETMLGDFGMMPQEKDTPFFKAVNSSRLGIQMMKKIVSFCIDRDKIPFRPEYHKLLTLARNLLRKS